MSKEAAERLFGDEGWAHFLHDHLKADYMKKIMKTLKHERSKTRVHPKSGQVFRAFRKTPLEEVKVVIIGQDPYPHDAANGLAFSYDGSYQSIPASLQNIFEEVERDLGFSGPTHNPDLSRWAEQGVLLLNTVLTVRHGEPGSHRDIGWQRFTRYVIELIGHKKARKKIFILWGNHAQSFLDDGYISPMDHWCLRASHPSPRSAHISFEGCGHFSQANEKLKREGYEPINWTRG